MPTIARVGDLAGGAIGNSRGIASTCNGIVVAVAGDQVAPHAPCPTVPVHCSAETTASPSVTVNGIRVVLNGDPATCGHGAAASSSSTIEPS